MFARAHPDLLIADIGMPEEDGYSLIASIREMETGTSHVPAIALTARTRAGRRASRRSPPDFRCTWPSRSTPRRLVVRRIAGPSPAV